MRQTNFMRILIFVLIGAFVLSGVFTTFRQCSAPPVPVATGAQHDIKAQRPAVALPAFQADSAWTYIKKQTDFGARVPNTAAHQRCAVWLAAAFRRYGLEVIEQKFSSAHYKGYAMQGVNIIGQYRPELHRRILFAAHWDSRFIADHDPENPTGPVMGADDGGSGVGVILEMARLLQQHPAEIGVDFVLFDLEDQGNDAASDDKGTESWCLGSQYWSKNLHRPGYMPLFGILLDMVGGANPVFAKEGISMQAAPGIVELVWKTAASLGYGHIFVQQQTAGITDDHVFVMRNARIPMVDIINRPAGTASGFVPHWHTRHDGMEAIDKQTLRAVGETCIAVLYQQQAVVQ